MADDRFLVVGRQDEVGRAASADAGGKAASAEQRQFIQGLPNAA